MSKRAKGLSFEEKRKRMTELFYETKCFFNIKELERICPAQKGIISQTVKEVLQSLVDDRIVDSEKVGSSIYYWAFPSKAVQGTKRRRDDLAASVEDERQKRAKLQSDLDEALLTRPPSEERTRDLAELAALEAENARLREKIDKYKAMDPEVIEAKQKETKELLDAANRWTDNLFNIQSYCSNKFSLAPSEFRASFNIPEDFDYIEA
ncbi:hypothetical protein H696_01922 [Fonticula alba]|uniref:Meiotic nuclear division protein 1 homolog n=1 Tax=Fonticula alba TaxID=691883 RepID=A0A058Z9S0_FONAL|nr:hypothetical protein H696_01922 [Fonticula alba]KCV70975.1 hypothetical protein H696_01922 [Fonticula alba]|eukprot:XP_009494098.1 hypothetical protein H696_01922 [Fonticula alba]